MSHETPTTRFARTMGLSALAIAAITWMVGCGSAMEADYEHGSSIPTDQGAPNPNQQSRTDDDTDHQSGENYEKTEVTPFHSTDEETTSTFSIDVDTGSYTLMRRDIRRDTLPRPAGVRAEEYINFFQYDYPEPQGDHPFSITTETGPSEFGPERGKLMRIGLKAGSLDNQQLPPTNLVFLIDVSGSMSSPNKLPAVKQSLRSLLDQLRPTDTVGIVVYAGADGVVLEPTPASERDTITDALDQLESGGSTNGEAGIVRAYEMAQSARKEQGINRVMLATDGDFNVGKRGEELIDLIEEYRKKHISLTTLGYGSGNYNDGQMEQLANHGNGSYYYIDSQEEAERIFGPELAATLGTIASDVKIQVEFDKEAVERYRLVGYDNRALDNEDFEDDKKDAGEIGPGHTVTAYYEVVPAEQMPQEGQLAEVRLRYKDDYGEESKLVKRPVKTTDVISTLEETSADFRFGAAVAEYAEILRESKHSDGARFDRVISMAESATKERDRRSEFISLATKASELWSDDSSTK